MTSNTANLIGSLSSSQRVRDRAAHRILYPTSFMGVPQILVPRDSTSKDIVSIANTTLVAGGSYGNVYEAKLITSSCNIIDVAVKEFRKWSRQTDIDIRRRALRERDIWGGLDHENIVSFKGLFVSESESESNAFCNNLFLVSEWACHGTALQYLEDHPHHSHLIVSGFMNGLAYMHSKEVGHMDLKPDNIVVGQGPCAKICDFGQAIQAFEGGLSATNTGCVTYTSPEIALLIDSDLETISPRRLLYQKADVYSFGLTAYEFLTKQRPFAGLRNQHQIYNALVHDHQTLIRNAPTRDTNVSEPLFNLFQSCWSINPESRPTMERFKQLYAACLSL